MTGGRGGSEREGNERDDASLVLAARAGDQDAFTVLFRRWFDPTFDVARRILHDDGLAAEVAQDTFLGAWTKLDTLRDPQAFGGWVLRTARNRALNRLDKERRARPTDDEAPELASLDAGVDVAAEVAGSGHHDLVWAAAAALGERDASVLDLHLRHGLGPGELAEELDVSPNHAYQLLFRMKARLGTAVRAWVLYRDGSPRCETLAGALAAARIDRFGAEAVKVIDRHASGCDVCEPERAAILAPEALFAAVPLLVAAGPLRGAVVDQLRAAGVPLGADATTPLPRPEQTAADAGPGGDGSTVGGSGAASAAEESPALDDLAAAEASSARRWVAIGALLLALLVLVGVGVVLAGGDDADVVAAGVEATTTTVATAPQIGTSTPPGSARAGSSSTTAPSLPLGDASTTTTAAAPPPTTSPTIAAPSTSVAPPTTAAPTTTAAPPPPPPPAPTIDSFSVMPASVPGGACPGGQWAVTMSWSTSWATVVTVRSQLGPTTASGPPDQPSQVVCALSPGEATGQWTLTATGPGGSAQQNAP